MGSYLYNLLVSLSLSNVFKVYIRSWKSFYVSI